MNKTKNAQISRAIPDAERTDNNTVVVHEVRRSGTEVFWAMNYNRIARDWLCLAGSYTRDGVNAKVRTFYPSIKIKSAPSFIVKT